MTNKINLNELTNTDFEALMNKTFNALNAGSQTFELLEISLLGDELKHGERQSFSLLFRSENTSSPQQNIYQLEHEELGQMDLFLVPVGPDEQGMMYEAIFT